MHMADALLSPAVGGAFWAGSAAAIGLCSKKIRDAGDDRIVPLMGVLGAFIFAAQMLNFSIPGTGSSGHLGGGIILAALLGPHAAFIVMASVLTVQALFFADGGLLALGCNMWNLGAYPCFVAYPLIFKPMVGAGGSSKMFFAASLLSAVAGLQLGAFSVVLETLASGRLEIPFGTFLLLMQPIHLAIGLIEGLATAGIVLFVKNARPEILDSAGGTGPARRGSLAGVLAFVAICAVISGGALSLLASSDPDGLEWSIERITGERELPERGAGITGVLKRLQETTAIMPDYSFKKQEPQPGATQEKPEQPAEPFDAGTPVSGILGSTIVLCAVLLAGFIAKRRNRCRV